MTAMTADTGQRQSSRARAVEPPADAPTREACSFGAALHQTHQNYAADLAERLKKAGHSDLTLPQLVVMAAIKAHPGGSQTDLVGLTGIDRSTLADVVRRMQKKGLLQRRRTKEDARAYAVRLTDRGAALLPEAVKAMKAADAAMRAQILDWLRQHA
jgi:DNA-binding MarR family transcriptional regulator